MGISISCLFRYQRLKTGIRAEASDSDVTHLSQPFLSSPRWREAVGSELNPLLEMHSLHAEGQFPGEIVPGEGGTP